MTMPDELDPERLAQLREAARALPAEVEPTADLWPAIRARIEAGRVQAMPPRDGAAEPARDPARAPAPAPMPWYAAPRRLAAAAVLLVTLTATATWFASRPGTPDVAVVPTGVEPAAAPAASATPSTPGAPGGDALASFASYEASAQDLAKALEERRAKLDPATVAAIEQSLRTIDSALVAARAALAQDPTSQRMRAYVEAAYRQKLDFLRRANDVASTWTL